MARFGGLYVRSDDFVYSGTITFDKTGVDFWDGARFVIGYNDPTEFEVIDFQRGGIFYTKRTNDVSTGWQHYTSVPYLFKQGESYDFAIKVIDGKLYVDVNGDRIIDGYAMPADRCEKGFGVFNSKSAFTIESLVISVLEKEENNGGGGTTTQPEEPGCGGSLAGYSAAAAAVALGCACAVALIVRKKNN